MKSGSNWFRYMSHYLWKRILYKRKSIQELEHFKFHCLFRILRTACGIFSLLKCLLQPNINRFCVGALKVRYDIKRKSAVRTSISLAEQLTIYRNLSKSVRGVTKIRIYGGTVPVNGYIMLHLQTRIQNVYFRRLFSNGGRVPYVQVHYESRSASTLPVLSLYCIYSQSVLSNVWIRIEFQWFRNFLASFGFRLILRPDLLNFVFWDYLEEET